MKKLENEQVVSHETYNARASKAYAVRSLQKWAQEMSEGEGKPNLLANLREQFGGGDGDGLPTPPGKLFSPRAEQADQIIKDCRLMEPRIARLLIAKAIGLSLNDMAKQFGASRSQMQIEIESALGSFRMGLQLRQSRFPVHERKKA